MNQNSLESRGPKQEKLEVKIEIATEKDLEAIKTLWLSAAKDKKDASLLGLSLQKEETNINSLEFKKNLFNYDRFVVLAKNGSEVIGASVLRWEREAGFWRISYAYVKPDFRGEVGLKMLFVGLNKLLDENAKNVTFVVKRKNQKMIKFAKRISAVKLHPVWVDKDRNEAGKFGYLMELDLTNPEVVKKLKRVSNAS